MEGKSGRLQLVAVPLKKSQFGVLDDCFEGDVIMILKSQ